MTTSLNLLGKSLAESLGSSSSSSGVTVSFATVTAIHEYTSDVKVDVSLYGGTLYGLSMTTGCRGVAVGDRVIVQTYGHLSVVTGVIAHDNTSYVMRAGDTMVANGCYSGYITDSGTLLNFSIPCVCCATPYAAGDWRVRVRAAGSYVVGTVSAYETIAASNIQLTAEASTIWVTMTVSASGGNNYANSVLVTSSTIGFS